MTWLTNWNYRKPITISNTGSLLSDYQTIVTIDTATLVTAGKLLSNCNDIRFALSDGSTLLNYWIESGPNTPSTKIWVKIPSIANGSNTIYLYYSNSLALSESNGTNTFVFFDDFEDGNLDGWVQYYSGMPVVISTQWASPGETYSAKLVRLPLGNWADSGISRSISITNLKVIVDARLYSTDGNGVLEVAFGTTGRRQISSVGTYINFESNAITNTPPFDILLRTGATRYTNDQCTGYFDRIRIRKYMSPEPTLSSIGTEEIFAMPANITATSMTITPSENPCRQGICTVTVDVIWTNTGGTSGSFVPNITIDGSPITPIYPSQSLAKDANVTKTFIITDLSAGSHPICPDPN